MWKLFSEALITLRMLTVWMTRRKKHLKESIEVGNKIEEVLRRICLQTGADRAYVFQFHNGQYFYTGNSIDKMTNTHEYALEGISREQLLSRDIMTSPYRRLLENLFVEKVYTCYNVSDLNDYNTQMFLDSRGTVSFAMTLMKDANGKALGFVGIDFVKGHINPDNSHLSISILDRAGRAVYDLLIYGESKKANRIL